ncbi:class I SAM-dependent DNA methyltransferase [Verrucomicrobiota bacterium]
MVDSEAVLNEFFSSDAYLNDPELGYTGYLAPSSESCRRIQARKLLRVMRDVCGIDARTLEIGCGTAALVRTLRDQGHECDGIDLSSTMARAARNLNSVDILCGDFMSTEYKPGSYRRICMFGVIGTVRSVKDTLVKVHNVLEPLGWLVMNYMDFDHWTRNVLGKHYHRQSISSRFCLNRGTVERYLDSAGFELVREISDWKWTTLGSLPGFLRSHALKRAVEWFHLDWVPLLVPVPGGRLIFARKRS